jgi:RNA polymerase sigma-70 factor, ECF subfamily
MMVIAKLRRANPAIAITAEGLVKDYLTDVFRYVARRLPLADRATADDITAQTFQAALQGLHRLKPGTDPYPWLLGIARRELINRARRRKNDIGLTDATLINFETPEHLTLSAERRTELWRILDALPPDQRESLLLQHLEDLSIAQIADMLGKSHAATNSLLQRARQNALARGGAYFLNDEDEDGDGDREGEKS